VSKAANGKFVALWRGEPIYQAGEIRQFDSEAEGWQFLARCEVAGRIVD
jgi:hypothetical protein